LSALVSEFFELFNLNQRKLLIPILRAMIHNIFDPTVCLMLA